MSLWDSLLLLLPFAFVSLCHTRYRCTILHYCACFTTFGRSSSILKTQVIIFRDSLLFFFQIPMRSTCHIDVCPFLFNPMHVAELYGFYFLIKCIMYLIHLLSFTNKPLFFPVGTARISDAYIFP